MMNRCNPEKNVFGEAFGPVQCSVLIDRFITKYLISGAHSL